MQIVQETNGTWTLRDRIKCSDDKYHNLKVRGYKKKSEAKQDYVNQVQAFLSRFNERIDNGIKLSTSDELYSLKSVCDEYIFDFSTKQKKSTTNKLSGVISNYILNYFDEKNNVNQIFTELNMSEWKKNLLEKNLCTETVNQVISVMRRIVDRTIKRDLLGNKEGNKCLLMLDAIKRDEVKEKTINFWTPDEYLKFIGSFKDNDKFRILFETFYYTGLRCGELSGLQWKHFDIENRQLHIRQQANNKLGTGKAEITSPKTKSGIRDIDLNDCLLKDLIEFKQATCTSEEDFIFFGSSPASPTNIRRQLDIHISLSGVKKIRIHDLRHSHASLLISLGADPFFIMKRLGHASYEETTKTYGHLFPNVTKTIISKLDIIGEKEKNVITIGL